jgi:hypothetical protein
VHPFPNHTPHPARRHKRTLPFVDVWFTAYNKSPDNTYLTHTAITSTLNTPFLCSSKLPPPLSLSNTTQMCASYRKGPFCSQYTLAQHYDLVHVTQELQLMGDKDLSEAWWREQL